MRTQVQIKDTSTPVLVFPSADHGPLGITRTLGRLGIPVYNLDSSRLASPFFSRYSQGKFRLDILAAAGAEAVEALLSAGRRIGRRSILITTTDDATIFVAGNADALKEWFIFPEQGSELVRSLCSKKGMYHLARANHIPTPEASFPQSRQDVLDFLDRAVFPVMLKGTDGARMFRRTGKKMFIVRTARELLEKYDLAADPADPDLMLQEYIPGGDDSVWMFNGYFNERSECLVGFTGKKIRQYPIHTGSTSLGICLRNQHVEEVTQRFMRAVRYRGILDIGYRYDARDCQYKVLDVNPRIGATFRLFVGQQGIDVARALYLDLTGGPVPPDSLRHGRKWLVEDLDLVSCIRYFWHGSITARQWLTSFRGVEELGYLAADDPLPLLPMAVSGAAELFERTVKRLRRAVLPNPGRGCGPEEQCVNTTDYTLRGKSGTS